jgi:hypothetical protein
MPEVLLLSNLNTAEYLSCNSKLIILFIKEYPIQINSKEFLILISQFLI